MAMSRRRRRVRRVRFRMPLAKPPGHFGIVKCRPLCVRLVPVPPARQDRRLVADEAVLEKVEDGKLVARHDVRRGLGLDLGPDAGQGLLEDLADGRVLGAVGALAGNLESLRDGGILVLLVAGGSHDVVVLVGAVVVGLVLMLVLAGGEGGELGLAIRH
jgi:hypothetical protein